MTRTIDREELRTLIDADNGVIVLEALPPMYYDREHLPGAINLPHDRVDELAPVLVPDRASPVVVYCANRPCSNSTVAANRLTALGYTDVREYAGGKEDWISAGLPVESTVPARR